MPKLTAKQARFVDEYLIDLNATQAAIRAGYSEKTAQEQSSRLLSKVMVQEAVQEGQKIAQNRAAVTLQDILDELDENRKVALCAETPQASAATAATMGKAKLLGFMVDKVEHAGTIHAVVDKAPKLSKEEWLKAHGLTA